MYTILQRNIIVPLDCFSFVYSWSYSLLRKLYVFKTSTYTFPCLLDVYLPNKKFIALNVFIF